MAEFKWKEGRGYGVEAQTAGEELERIGSLHGGVVRPVDVVQESRPEVAPLHPCFTWDDARAATLYRESEARQVIHSIQVVTPTQQGPRPVLAYVHIPQPADDQGCTQGYMPVAKVMTDTDLRQIALTEAVSLLRGVQQRYAHLEELAEVFAAIDEVAKPAEPAKSSKRKRKVSA